jgi:N-acetyl-gamma-glutamyl-phosphate reductase
MIKASILGASGYSGAELLKILLRHPRVTIEKLFANTSASKRVDEVYPIFGGRTEAAFEQYSPESACSSDIVFVALPSGEAMNLVPELLDRKKKVIDLGGDFRLREPSLYAKYYKHEHTSSHLLSRSVYGLPELNRDQIKSAHLVANPGCYPTSAILPLVPVLKEGLVGATGIVINSLSGVSGAGRSSSADLSFAEVNESVKAYKVTVHQHIPEIKSTLESFIGVDASFSFVPHLLPITRGIYTTIYAPMKNSLSQEGILEAYQHYYGNEPFVRFSSTVIPEIKHVSFTNYIDIGFRIDYNNNHLIICSAIDNLIKGAAGQAVQNMNLMFGFAETEGLI